MRTKWHEFRTTNFLIGLACSISLVIAVINYSVEKIPYAIESETKEEFEELTKIIRTKHPVQKKSIPIPKPEKIDLSKIILEEAIIDEKPFETIDTLITTVDTVIGKYEIGKPSNLPERPPLIDIVEENIPDEIPYRNVQLMAYYGNCSSLFESKEERKECSDLALMQHMNAETKYPKIAKDNNIQGTVVLELIIGKEGQLESAKIIRDIGGGCGQAALDAAYKMDKWSPAKQGGRKVKLLLNLPVRFKLD